MTGLRQDIQFALRSLRKSPGFTAIAVLTLALGIGANTAIFTVVNAVLFHPLAVQDPSRVMEIYTVDQQNRGGRYNYLPVSYPNGEDVQRRSRSFSGISLYSSTGVSMTIGGVPEHLAADLVSGSFFDVLGVKPALGRTFGPEEDAKPGASPLVVLSYGVWERKFGSNRNVINQNVLLNGQSFTVIGVAAPGFQGASVLNGPDVWIPLAMHDQIFSGLQKTYFNERRFLSFFMVGRLKEGVNAEQARAELHNIGSDLEHEFPSPNRNRNFVILPLLESSIDPNFRSLFTRAGGLLMGVVGLVLLIACANIANLLLARAAGRKREVSIRLALGASRSRIVAQLLTESMILGLIGGATGLVLAMIGRNLLWNFRPPSLQLSYLSLDIDAKVLFFNLFIALSAGVICGLAPALRSTSPDLVSELKERAGGDGSSRRFGLYQAFIMVEVALSVISLISAGLFLNSLRKVQQINPGFDTHNLAMLSFDVGSLNYEPARSKEFQRRVVEVAQSTPGVSSASLSSDIPLFTEPSGRSVFLQGQENEPGRNGVLVLLSYVGQDYLQTMGIPLRSGQGFDSSVREDSRKVAIVNETGAHQFWPNQDPIGKQFRFFTGDWISIIGVARDSKYNTLGEDATPYLYLPLIQNPAPEVTLFFRASTSPEATLSAVRSRVQALDHNLPITNTWPIGEVISQRLWAARFGASLLSIFAAVALILCAVGINGVVGYTVGRRVREIGIRMALGARPGDVVLMVLKQSATTLVIGLAVGLASALLLGRFIAGLLYGVSVAEPLTFAATVVVLALVGIAASYFPARRAARVDPMVALHQE